MGFLTLRSMMESASFNTTLSPDPSNIGRDVATFDTLWSPGQYLIPGVFVWLCITYGSAMLLTMLISIWAGLAGWDRVAAKFGASPYARALFVMGLALFQFNTSGEITGGGRSGGLVSYNGGESLIFAASPWSLLLLLRSLEGSVLSAFLTTLLAAALLFFMKLIGLVIFAATVLALSAVYLVREKRVRGSLFGMWAAAATATALLEVFWIARGPVAVSGSHVAFTWDAVLFPLAASAFSGVSGLDLASYALRSDRFAYVCCALLGGGVAWWIWLRLKNSPHRKHRNLRAIRIALSARA